MASIMETLMDVLEQEVAEYKQLLSLSREIRPSGRCCLTGLMLWNIPESFADVLSADRKCR